MNTAIDLGRERNAAAELTAATYNSAADGFDDPALGFWERCGRRTVERLRLPRAATVLDVGCGTGASALHAARRVGPRGRVLGVDLAEGLLRQAERKAVAEGLANVQFRVGDMTDLELPDASFDAVVCVFAIFFVPDMRRQMAELWRMVRPGGHLAITTWGRDLFEPGRTIFWSSIRRHRPDLERRFSPWDELVEPRALRDLFAVAGVFAPEIYVENDAQPLASADDWWKIVRGTGYRWTIDQLTPAEQVRVRQENVRALCDVGAGAVLTNSLCAVAQKPAPHPGELIAFA
jgi:ubiquinone/menaquinone biosynthesis C-methylase UbiE